MAENESLDIGAPYAKRWDVICTLVRKGESRDNVATRIGDELYKGLRNALKQCKEKGVTLEDLLKKRHCQKDLRKLLRMTQGHDYIQLFASAAGVCGPTKVDCVAGWISSVLDKITDQICYYTAGCEHYPTMEDAQKFTHEVLEQLSPVVERIVTKLSDDPNWLPKRLPAKDLVLVNATAELMDTSLLGVRSQ